MPMITKEGTSSQSKVSSFKSFRLASDSAQGHFFQNKTRNNQNVSVSKSFTFHCCPPISLSDPKGRHPIFRFSVNLSRVVSSQSNCRDLLTRLFYQIIYRSMNMVNNSIQYYSFLPYQMVQKFNNSKVSDSVSEIEPEIKS